LIQATIKYLEDNPTKYSSRLIERLQLWITPNPNSPLEHPLLKAFLGGVTIGGGINYERIQEDVNNEDLLTHDLTGLLKFVNHSDADGYLSKGDTVDFYDLMTKIYPYIEVKDEDDKWFYENILKFSKRCVDHGRGMSFH
jgi:hypothetical protein